MLKSILLGGAMIVAAPALAQTTTPSAQNAQAAPAQGSFGTATLQSTTPDPAAIVVPAQAPAPTASQPAATGNQIAQVVDSEFPSYDKDADGDLDETEFASWMVALKTASDPTTKAESADTKAWVGAAFAQADADKSKAVTKTELTGFLSQGAS